MSSCSRILRASIPVEVVNTLYSSSKVRERVRKMSFSSSTIKSPYRFMPFSTQMRWQLDNELCPPVYLALHRYTAAVLLDDPVGNAQSKPRAFPYGLGRKERIQRSGGDPARGCH